MRNLPKDISWKVTERRFGSSSVCVAPCHPGPVPSAHYLQTSGVSRAFVHIRSPEHSPGGPVPPPSPASVTSFAPSQTTCKFTRVHCSWLPNQAPLLPLLPALREDTLPLLLSLHLALAWLLPGGSAHFPCHCPLLHLSDFTCVPRPTCA